MDSSDEFHPFLRHSIFHLLRKVALLKLETRAAQFLPSDRPFEVYLSTVVGSIGAWEDSNSGSNASYEVVIWMTLRGMEMMRRR